MSFALTINAVTLSVSRYVGDALAHNTHMQVPAFIGHNASTDGDRIESAARIWVVAFVANRRTVGVKNHPIMRLYHALRFETPLNQYVP